MVKPRMDALDRHIIEALTRDASLSDGQLATTIGVSRNTIGQHRRKLIKDGALRLAYQHTTKDGGNKVAAYILIEKPTDARKISDTIKFLEKNSNTFPFVMVAGERLDYIAFVGESTPKRELNRFASELFAASRATTRTIFVLGDPPDGTPELPISGFQSPSPKAAPKGSPRRRRRK